MKAALWNDLHPNDPPRHGLIILDAPSKSGDGSQYVACGGEDAERLNETARRIVALWNAAEELDLTTEAIREGTIQRTFTLAESRAGVIEAELERIENLEAEKAVMLEALEEVKNEIDSYPRCPHCGYVHGEGHKGNCLGFMVEAAIRKARGEE